MTTPERFTVLDGGPTLDEREGRLVEGADELVGEGRRGSVFGHERFLISVAAALMTLGISVILIGWAGAANSTLLEEQVPYLISGGLLGLALTTVGALTLFSHWLTVGIREARSQEAARRRDHRELMDALGVLAGRPVQQEDNNDGPARGSRSQRPLRPAARRS
jgi:hypothetical protein